MTSSSRERRRLLFPELLRGDFDFPPTFLSIADVEADGAFRRGDMGGEFSEFSESLVESAGRGFCFALFFLEDTFGGADERRAADFSALIPAWPCVREALSLEPATGVVVERFVKKSRMERLFNAARFFFFRRRCRLCVRGEGDVDFADFSMTSGEDFFCDEDFTPPRVWLDREGLLLMGVGLLFSVCALCPRDSVWREDLAPRFDLLMCGELSVLDAESGEIGGDCEMGSASREELVEDERARGRALPPLAPAAARCLTTRDGGLNEGWRLRFFELEDAGVGSGLGFTRGSGARSAIDGDGDPTETPRAGSRK